MHTHNIIRLSAALLAAGHVNAGYYNAAPAASPSAAVADAPAAASQGAAAPSGAAGGSDTGSAGSGSSSGSGYTLADSYTPQTFDSDWTFFSGSDPTHGFVKYLSKEAAAQAKLYDTSSQIVLKADSTTVVTDGSGRAAIRLESVKTYTHGLFISDVQHMPSVPGGWPALWSFGAGWPANGEIDVIEGVNMQNFDQMTLHTSEGFTAASAGGTVTTFSNGGNTDCGASGGTTGCGFAGNNPAAYGAGFNSAQGGVYAMEWTSEAIKIWFFPRSSIPTDISSGKPNPDSWATPVASFKAAEGSQSIDDHFKEHNIIINLTFCGDWAGQVYQGGQTACNAYVGSNPSQYGTDAEWIINSVKVYTNGGASSKLKARAFQA